MFSMILPADVLFIIDTMRSHGYSAHVVGGSLRDSLIGRELGDFDITTNALPEQTKAVFENYRIIDTGIKHGTVTLVLDGIPYEITTYRVDGDYRDNRHPESVTFTASLAEDLARRDFTVNAMAYAPSSGLVDPFSGRADAKERIIRAVGDPYRRFDEDALRILRALRFASVLSFDIEENTANAARELAGRLSSISKERVYAELKKLMSGDNAHRVISEYSDVIGCAIDGVTFKNLPDAKRFSQADYLTRLAALVYLNSENPRGMADEVLTSLKTDKFTRTYIDSVLGAYCEAEFRSVSDLLKLLMKHGNESVTGVLRLGILLGKYTEREEKLLSDALESGKPYTVSGLDVRGGDLTALGIRGELVGEALKKLLIAVIDGEVENKREALIGFLAN